MKVPPQPPPQPPIQCADNQFAYAGTCYPKCAENEFRYITTCYRECRSTHYFDYTILACQPKPAEKGVCVETEIIRKNPANEEFYETNEVAEGDTIKFWIISDGVLSWQYVRWGIYVDTDHKFKTTFSNTSGGLGGFWDHWRIGDVNDPRKAAELSDLFTSFWPKDGNYQRKLVATVVVEDDTKPNVGTGKLTLGLYRRGYGFKRGYLIGTREGGVNCQINTIKIRDNDTPLSLGVKAVPSIIEEDGEAVIHIGHVGHADHDIDDVKLSIRSLEGKALPSGFTVNIAGTKTRYTGKGPHIVTLGDINGGTLPDTTEKIGDLADITLLDWAPVRIEPIENTARRDDNGELIISIYSKDTIYYQAVPSDCGDFCDGHKASVTVTIKDNTEPPTLSLSTEASTITEGETATFTLTASRASTTDIPVNARLALVTNGRTFDPASTSDITITIPAGQTSATYTVTTEDDETHQPESGSIGLTLNSGDGYLLNGTPAQTVTVYDNDEPPQWDFSLSPSSITTAKEHSITITINNDIGPRTAWPTPQTFTVTIGDTPVTDPGRTEIVLPVDTVGTASKTVELPVTQSTECQTGQTVSVPFTVTLNDTTKSKALSVTGACTGAKLIPK